jgi:hypothetical protein
LGSTRGMGGGGAQSASAWMTGFAEWIRARARAPGEVGPADYAAWHGTNARAGPTTRLRELCSRAPSLDFISV